MTFVSLVSLVQLAYSFVSGPFLLGSASAPPSLDVTVTEFTGCTLRVEWSEPLISCGGSVSQYVLTVTPPTSDCQSSPDCSLTTDGGSSVITAPGTQTAYSLSVTSQNYDITIELIHGVDH